MGAWTPLLDSARTVPLAAGQLLSTYEILGTLGAGGMGDVYRARDTRLEREVAIKVLSPEAAADPARLKRFLREARALAALDHPNIVAVHSVEEADGLHFLTMALIRGRSLAEIIPESGMPPAELLPLARAIAEGVSVAHAHGIIHRDLKPANIMVTDDGQVRIVDFGLARIGPQADRSLELTGEGVAVGTIPYMSPEQLRGAPVDARSDIFSLGVILFEMASARRPFRGECGAEVISSILHDEPRPLGGRCRERAPSLEAVVRRCLEKSPERRYPSVGELLQDLARMDTEPAPGALAPASGGSSAAGSRLTLPARPSLAVLPFRDLGGDPEESHLATGLWLDLNAELVKFAGLFLLNGTSTATFQGRTVDPREVGSQLGVRHVLEGTVRRAGERIRITVQLVDVETGQPVWADRYDSELADLFEVQDRIIEKILAALDVQLLYGEGARAMRTAFADPRARELLYLALPLAFSTKPENLEKARRLLENLEQLEPGQAETYSHLGWTHYFEAAAGWCTDPERALDQAAAYAERAIEIGDPAGMGHMLMAAVYLFRRQHDRALEAGRETLDRRPGCPWAYAILGNIHNYSGEPHQAIQMAWRAIRLSPLVPDLFPAVMATGYYLLGQAEDAIAAARSAIQLDPDSLDAHVVLLASLATSGRTEEVRTAASEIRRIKPDFDLEAFARRQPYRDPSHLEGLLADLRRAGL